MWDSTNLVLANANHGFWYSDRMEWSWMSGLHGLFWPLMIILIVAIPLVAFHLGMRDVRSHETATASSARRRPNSARDILDGHMDGDDGHADEEGDDYHDE